MNGIYEAIPKIMAEIGAIGKDKRNTQQNFMYRGVDDVMNALQPLLYKHGVFIVPEVVDQKREERVSNKGNNLIYSVCTVNYTFFAADGSAVKATVVGEGMDSGDKATNKAMAIAFKYACFQVFCIPTEEMKDPDGDTPPESKPKQWDDAPQEAPPKKPVDPKDNILFTCADCGKTLQPYTDAQGKMVGVRRLAEASKKAFGRTLCVDCAEDEGARMRLMSDGVDIR